MTRFPKSLSCFLLIATVLSACDRPEPQPVELFEAVKHDDVQRAELLLSNGMSANVKDAAGQTPLVWAIDRHNVKMAKLLIEKKADVNLAVKDASPLGLAVFEAQPALVHLLMDNGANINWVSPEDGSSLLDLAAGSGNEETVSILLDAGVDVHAVNHWGMNALFNAVLSGNSRVVETLLKAGCDPDQKAKNGHTARDVALYSKAAAIRQLLAQKAK
jgi:ankyrin repeat protein